ncbi:PAS domain S-box protein [Nitratidesulfovibrio liaohensis]|uniref:histidine kinase n=1 Tax=Nitratidesulfovibrio liaohensis TaxID=2604158 RepID=A0ABY9R4E7_9BACT|nr:PAS domain S-box protein [Nitratidesulfovibrio liaohensis]WMW66181.1 cache domain-containing protein [Nitratidesulfovibrio liaohensis]
MNAIPPHALSSLLRSPPVRRLWLLLILACGVFTLFLLHAVHTFWETAETYRRSHLREMVLLARNQVQPVLDELAAGVYGRDHALVLVRERVRTMIFNDTRGPNYIFMSSYDGTVMVQPYERQMEGRSGLDLRDADGVPIIAGLIRTAQANPDGGYFSYRYTPPGGSAPEEKLSFVLPIPELACYIGTGTYLGDVHVGERRYILATAALAVTVFTLLGLTFVTALGALARRGAELEREVEERKATEQRLAAAELKYRSIFQNAQEGIAVIQDGLLRFVNPRIGEILRRPAQEVVGTPFTDHLHPADRPVARDRYLRRLNGEPLGTYPPLRICVPDGERWVFGTGVLLEWDGRPAVLVMLTDITDLKEAEQALHAREQQFRAVLTQAPFAMALLHPDGTLREANAEWLSLHGLAEATGNPAVYTPDQDRYVLHAGLHGLAQAALAGEPIATEPLEFPPDATPDGQTRWMALRLYPVAGAPGTPDAVVFILNDLTVLMESERERQALLADLSRANRALSRAQRHLKGVLDAMPSVIVVADAADRVVLWNPAAERRFGVAAPSAHGRPLAEIAPELIRHLPRLHAARRSGMATPPERVVTPMELPAGTLPGPLPGESRRVEDVTAIPLETGEEMWGILRLDDVSERAAMEDLMVQAEKMASVGGLAAGMAHEINNPLGGILQGVQNLRRRLLDDLPANRAAAERQGVDFGRFMAYTEERRIGGLLDSIRESGERAARIVANMLTFSRRSDPSRIPVQINDLLERTLELAVTDYSLARNYDFKRIAVVRRYDPQLPPVRCSASEMEQVFLNLFKNAAQALALRDNGPPPVLTVTTALEAAHLRIEVADNGPGMSSELRRRAFEPFFTTREAGAGTGLGLSVAYFIVVTNHKGTITIEESPEGGAVVVVRLPPA